MEHWDAQLFVGITIRREEYTWRVLLYQAHRYNDITNQISSAHSCDMHIKYCDT